MVCLCLAVYAAKAPGTAITLAKMCLCAEGITLPIAMPVKIPFCGAVAGFSPGEINISA